MCKASKVKVNQERAKPSQLVRINDIVQVNKNGFHYIFKVTKILAKRVSATLAADAYQDLTPAEELNKYENWYIGKSSPEKREKGMGRPTKRERRDLESFKEYYFDDES